MPRRPAKLTNVLIHPVTGILELHVAGDISTLAEGVRTILYKLPPEEFLWPDRNTWSYYYDKVCKRDAFKIPLVVRSAAPMKLLLDTMRN